jgi:alkanesulfonate monooxygenase SsuD/methylene tetrahydromethanopterin reductase-like flavin-dependent oxidoreductase (luciferase family)
MQDTRAATNPLYNDNRLKLGVFGTNVSNGCAISTAPEALETSWPNTLAIARAADRLGLEALVPVARWKGFGGPTNFNGTSFETTTWAAGIAQATTRPAVFTTCHVPTVHPVMAAKQATTVDHISGGRFALNVVCGWFTPDFDMFGQTVMEHDLRYDYAAEWVEVMQRLWTAEKEFDFEGKFLRVKGGTSRPHPIQQPFPPLMNAGSSGKGQHFAAKYSDMAFIHLDPTDLEKSKAHIDSYRRLAREEYGRDIQVWCNAHVTQRDTTKEAQDYVAWFAGKLGDDVALDNMLRIQNIEMQYMVRERVEAFRFALKRGWGGFPLIGTAEEIADKMATLSRIGLDGMLLNWLDYEDGLARLARLMPMLEAAGLRAKAKATA